MTSKRPLRRRRFRIFRTLGLALLVMIVVGTILAFTPAPSLTATVSPPDRPAGDSQLPWLRTEQRQIVDAMGRRVLLRGFNDDALVSYPNDPPAPLDEKDAALMERAGFTVVRLGIDWAQLEPVRGQIYQPYLDRVADAVRLFNQHGMYVVLEMHFRLGWSPSNGYSGAPGWAHIDGVPNWNPLPRYTWSPSLSPAAWVANTYFWTSSDWQKDFFFTWKAVASRFRAVSGVAGYDLFNEPLPLPIPPRLFEKYWMWPLYQHAIEAVGSVDGNHLFFVEGILLFTLDTLMVPLHAPNLVYGNHIYEGSLVPPLWNGDPGPVQHTFAVRLKEAAVLNAPLWVGEMGHDLTQSGAMSYVDTLLNDSDDHQLGWAWWQWRESKYWGVRDRAGSYVNMDALHHLARPFLAAAPGGVLAGRGDGVAGRLDLYVDAGHGDFPVLVSWPELTLGTPALSGSCTAGSSWDQAGARLTISLRPGEGCDLHLMRAG